MYAEQCKSGWRVKMQILRYLNRNILDLISISAILVLSLFIFSFFLKDDISTYFSLKQKHSSLRISAERNASMLEDQQKKASDIAAMEMEMNDYKNNFKADNKTSYFLNYITAIARRHRIEISTVEPGEMIKDDAFTRRMYTTILSDGFYDVYNYLYRIEEDWKAVKIERVVMDGNSDDNKIQVVLTVAVLSI